MHHSHYLAVEAPYRRTGLGAALKRAPAPVVPGRAGSPRCAGRTTRCSTATPTSTCARLGAVGISYHVDHYGTLGGINGALPSDRVTVRWDLDGAAAADVARRASSTCRRSPPATSPPPRRPPSTARHELRAALQPLLDDGWLLVDVDRAAPTYTVAR